MELKRYQKDTLAILGRFFEMARISGPKAAYEAITREPKQAQRLGCFVDAYRPLDGLPSVPNVCLRLPTGGGKTILGAQSIAVARDMWIEKDFPVVLWLVPNNIIRCQTVEALNRPRHPYRRVLDASFGSRVRVFDIADFTQIRPHDIDASLCIVVGTIQTLRVNETEGRKVYVHHEELEAHFTAVSSSTSGLERIETGSGKGGVKYSFANLLHIHRPLMIVDEAHGAVTGLTREMQLRVNPCAIIEFTATPRLANNILHSVTAQELKLEDMIKLPICLSEHDTWQSAVNGAVNSRAALDEAARKDTDYIRPIVLFQAQSKNQEITIEVLKRHLMEIEHIPEKRIAIATGDQRELDGINLFDPECPIEYVITIEALKEGWDCSFAYVFCSVANIHSAQNVEQLLGRVLRMPYATQRKAAELNRAYAHIAATAFGEAAKALSDKLVSMGFEENEAADNIELMQLSLNEDSDLFAPRARPKPAFSYTFMADPATVSALKAKTRIGLEVEETADGRVKVTIPGHVDNDFEEAISGVLSESERSGFLESLNTYRYEIRQHLSPAELGEIFIIPRLRVEIQGRLEFADTDIFLESFKWSLLDHSSRLDLNEFDIRETTRSFEINLDGNQLTTTFDNEDQNFTLDVDVEGWSEENLVLWLDRQVRQPDISQLDLLRWLRDLTTHLTRVRKLNIAALMRCKFILARKIREKIAHVRKTAREGAYERYLFAPEANGDVSFDNGFTFKEGMYWDQLRYRGRYKFRRHFLGSDNVPPFDGKADGEEESCAFVIDSLSEVKYWIRNVARHPNSFWLPTATDKFYPDFVAQLTDSRILVVEYKGKLTADKDDTKEKRTIGELWEKMSRGRGQFMIAENEVNGRDVRKQIKDKISEKACIAPILTPFFSEMPEKDRERG